MQFTVYKSGSNKKKYGDVYVKQIINMFSGLGKESGGCWWGDISSLDKKQLIYNPTSISLPINLQTPQTYTFQFFRPHNIHLPTLKFIT
jgi:hypothetical protein